MEMSASSAFPVVIAEGITTKGHVSTRMNVYRVKLNPTHFGLLSVLNSGPGVAISNVKVSGMRNPIMRRPLE